MLAKQKRAIAEEALPAALAGDFKAAAQIRQRAYALDSPGSIGVDWGNWRAIWKKDSRYVYFLELEDFSDADNSDEKISAMKAGIFIDYLFDFKDCWGVIKQSTLITEPFHSDLLEQFLVEHNWAFECVNRELIYTDTKKGNISAKIYYEAAQKNGLGGLNSPQIFPIGEYDLGFYPDTPEHIIAARRHWLETYDLFLDMERSGIDKFPKTFQTFEKHKKANSEKYQAWILEYSRMKEKQEAPQ